MSTNSSHYLKRGSLHRISTRRKPSAAVFKLDASKKISPDINIYLNNKYSSNRSSILNMQSPNELVKNTRTMGSDLLKLQEMQLKIKNITNKNKHRNNHGKKIKTKNNNNGKGKNNGNNWETIPIN